MKALQIRSVLAWYVSLLMLLVLLLTGWMVKTVYDWGYDDAFYYMLAQEGEKALQIEERSPKQLGRLISPAGMMPELFTTAVYAHFSDLPDTVKTFFSPDSSSYELLVHEVGHEVVYLLPYGWSDRPEFYLLHRYSMTDEDNVGFFSLMLENRNILLVMIMLLFAYVLIMHLGLRLVQPVRELTRWVQQLDEVKSNPSERPNFKFTELEQVANQVQQSFQAVQQQAEKETQFLRSLSHELRTPLAISKAALELLNRQKNSLPEKVQSRLDKIQRANSNMIATSDSILWLWSQDPLPDQTQKIHLQILLQEIVRDHQHLLRGRQVNVVLPDSDLVCSGNQKVLTILFRNLIRNAFQYTAEGEVCVSLQGDQLCIDNPIRVDLTPDSEEGIKEYGFGIGLYLVQHICCRLGWQCRHLQHNKRFRVELSLPMA